MTLDTPERFNSAWALESSGAAQRVVYRRAEVILSQGDPCEHVFYLQQGVVKLSAVSKTGREGILAMLGPGSFFGDGCLAGHTVHAASATATTDSHVLVVEKARMLHLLHTQHALAQRFIAHLLARNIRIEEDLIDQMFNSSERRLARALLLLAGYGTANAGVTIEAPTRIMPPMTQGALADMIGTTRSRVNRFMKRFVALGFIEVTGEGVTVHLALRKVIVDE